MNLLSSLPIEIQKQIMDKAGLAVSSIALTSTAFRKMASTHSASKNSLMILSLLKQSYETARSEKIEGVTDRILLLQEIGVSLATLDIKLAIKIVDSIQNEPDKSRAQKILVQTVLKFDREKAFDIAKTIHQYRYQAEALVAVLEEVAVYDKNEALKIIDVIKPAEFKAQARIKLAKIRANFDLDEAIESIECLSKIDKIDAYCEIVSIISENNHTDIQKLTEKALKEALSFTEPDIKAESLARIVDKLSEKDLPKVEDIKNIAVEMSSSKNRNLLFLAIIKFLLPLDYKKALEVFFLIKSTKWKDSARLEIVKNLAKIDLAKACEEADLLIDEENKYLALREIGFQLIETDIEEAIHLARSIENKEHKNFLIREIVKKYALNDRSKAFDIAFFFMPENSPQQALAISDILTIFAEDEPELALEFLKTIETNSFKILILLECSKGLTAKNPILANKMLEMSMTAIESLKDNLEKSTFVIEIAKMINGNY